MVIHYIMSDDKHPCITECSEKGKYIYHPHTHTLIVDKEHSFCAVSQYLDGDKIVETKPCQTHTEMISEYVNNSSNNDTPISHFDDKVVLEKIYDIRSASECTDWFATNKSAPYITKFRILSSFLNIYDNTTIAFDENVISFFMYLIKKNITGTLKFYRILEKYVGVEEGKCVIMEPSKNTLKQSDHRQQRAEYLINYVTSDMITMILSKKISSDENALGKEIEPVSTIFFLIVNEVRTILEKQLRDHSDEK